MQGNSERNLYNELKTPLMNIFNLSPIFKYRCFSDRMSLVKFTPVFKKDGKCSISNYRSIAVLSCFSKIMEQTMYDRLYDYLTVSNILFNKQFGLNQRSMLF